MKLIVAGATGFVATEVIRQSLRLPAITSVIALARRPVSIPSDLGPDADASKLKTVLLKDFGTYTDDDKKELMGADACIWTLAITPTKARSKEWDEVVRTCHDYTFIGLKVMFEARNQDSPSRPFRFMYMSGSAAERDQTQTPRRMPQYTLMRGEIENELLRFEAEHKGQIEVCSAKPGLINEPGLSKGHAASQLANVAGVPSVLVTEVSAAMLDQVMNGFDKEPLTNDDLVEIGQKVLKASPKAA